MCIRDSTRNQRGMQVALGEEGVIVEHLLEVGNQPLRIHGVAMKATSQLIVYASGSHGLQSPFDHSQVSCVTGALITAKQEVHRHGLRELGRVPPAPVMGIVVPVSYTHLRAHETKANLVCRLLLEKKKK